MGTFSLVGAACAAIALIACEPAGPESAPPAPVESAAPDSIVDELPPAVQEDLAPELPAAPPTPAQPKESESPPPEATRPKAAATAAIAAVAAAKATARDSEHPPLDILLKQPGQMQTGGSSTIDLSRGAPDPATASDPGLLDRWRDHVRVERHTEAAGPSGPRQSTVSETEAALRIPVDKSVSLEGGVRVDSREDPGVKEPVRKSTPRVGVEVKF